MAIGAIELEKGPKRILVEKFNFRVISGMHFISFISGEEEFVFAVPMPASKALARGLIKQVEQIEKQTGKKVPDLLLSDEPVPSPLDLGKTGEEPKK